MTFNKPKVKRQIIQVQVKIINDIEANFKSIPSIDIEAYIFTYLCEGYDANYDGADDKAYKMAPYIHSLIVVLEQRFENQLPCIIVYSIPLPDVLVPLLHMT